ncbi:MAG: OmpH family outer membrane protein [Bacteroidia bacterium]|nr:OmpH family outer membrane protein [Bacteroidia bacterium]MBP9688285.1 OmpH family outer membrane protein [Bacteroidia bacterium]
MKKIFLLILLAGTAFASTHAQRFGYVDTEYILDMLPEYRSAQKQLELISSDWEKEIEKKQIVIDKMHRDFNAEQVLLTEEMRKKRDQEIKDKEKELREYRTQKFGYEGELFKKRQELIKPIQDKIFEAVQKVAKQSALDFIFAKGGDMIMLYSNAKYDKSDEVLTELGVAITKNKDNQQK